MEEKFKVGDRVMVSGFGGPWSIEEVYPNFHGMGNHAYWCKKVGTGEEKRFHETSLC